MQLLYYLYRSKNIQKMSIKIWLTLLKMETNFMNAENGKTNEPNKFFYQFTDKLNLKNPNNKNIGLVNLSITTHGKTLNWCITTINLKYLPQLGMVNLICLMDHIQSHTFKITLNLSSKNSGLWLKSSHTNLHQ